MKVLFQILWSMLVGGYTGYLLSTGDTGTGVALLCLLVSRLIIDLMEG